MTDPIKDISNLLIERYNLRLNNLGKNVKTLGWGSEEQQKYRFSVSSSLLPTFENKRVLDIGCGFGDFCLYLNTNNKNFQSYLGIDINEKLIEEAKKSVIGNNVNFEVFNILEGNPSKLGKHDLAFMFGILNFKLSDTMNNFDYTKLFLKKAFSLVEEALIFDVISEIRDPDYPKEEFIYYHNPLHLLEYCFTLTPFVSFLHDYKSIPQREMTIILSKNPRL